MSVSLPWAGPVRSTAVSAPPSALVSLASTPLAAVNVQRAARESGIGIALSATGTEKTVMVTVAGVEVAWPSVAV